MKTKLRILRTAKGMTQSELGEELGVTKFCVSLWENDERRIPSDKLPAIAQALSCTIDELFGKSGNADSK